MRLGWVTKWNLLYLKPVKSVNVVSGGLCEQMCLPVKADRVYCVVVALNP